MMHRHLAFTLIALNLTHTTHADAARSLADYRYFRALSIDLKGHIPDRTDIRAFEADSFDLDAWLETQLSKPAYAERMGRIYLDALRLDVAPGNLGPGGTPTLAQAVIKGPEGQDVPVLYRPGQLRPKAGINRTFCLTAAEAGFAFSQRTPAPPTTGPDPRLNVSSALLAERTVLVKPWWLYKNVDAPAPDYDPNGQFRPVDAAIKTESGGLVRVCKEEAQTAKTTTVTLGQKASTIPCASSIAFARSNTCGCGPNLETCMPAGGGNADPITFVGPGRWPLSEAEPFDSVTFSQRGWQAFWWQQEADRFLKDAFATDRDVRELLTARDTQVNGPLVQLYKGYGPGRINTNVASVPFLAAEDEPLFQTSALPALSPHAFSAWTRVADRGPRSAGLMTMPIFLLKYGTRRARAHILYNAFLCREFVAENVTLTSSTEPDLTVRPGCAACHKTLEPMAAYYTRVLESGWTFLPAESFPATLTNPTTLATCGASPGVLASPACRAFYDPEFTTAGRTQLRGAYGSLAHVEQGPRGLAEELTKAPEFASCVVSKIGASLLRRDLTLEDEAWRDAMKDVLVAHGFKTKALVKAILRSDRYRASNDVRMSKASSDGGKP